MTADRWCALICGHRVLLSRTVCTEITRFPAIFTIIIAILAKPDIVVRLAEHTDAIALTLLFVTGTRSTNEHRATLPLEDLQ